MRDPYYRQIVDRLAGSLDPKLFERCMQDVLRERFPTLVPVVGGGDAGFDGAIADGEREPYPLACTIASTFDKLERNLAESIRSADRYGVLHDRKIALATSFALTPAQRRRLIASARDLGVTVIDLIDRPGIADLLYRSPRWCKELLGLSGQPRALSAVPASALEPGSGTLIGRDDDLRWLLDTPGDRLLSGVPGSGKTFLLRHLVEQRGALFAVVDEQDAVANELRADQPPIVIVDDAHVHPGRVDFLQRLRREIGQSFDIVATCWPQHEDVVRRRLGDLPDARVRRLELLTRDELVELFQSLGVHAPASVLRDLVDQSANKPGLAAFLARAWHAGDLEEVFSGEVLRRNIAAALATIVKDIEYVLAAFAIGGDAGMPVAAVAGHLGAHEREIWLATIDLGGAGVLAEVEAETLRVEPERLRSALLRTAFFPDPARRSKLVLARRRFDELLEAAPSFASAVLALVECAAAGGFVPPRLLQDGAVRVAAEGSWRTNRIWQELAQLDAESASFVLERYPGEFLDVARATLRHAETTTVDRLLSLQTGASNGAPARWDSPMSVLGGWVREGYVSEEELLRRRTVLLERVRRFVQSGGRPDTGQRVGFLALDPSRDCHERDPGLGDEITLRWELLSPPAIERLGRLWESLEPLVGAAPAAAWPHVTSLLWSCAHPRSIKPTHVSDDQQAALQQLGRRILAGVVPLATGRPGLARRLEELAADLGFPLTIETDPVFEALFPERREESRDERMSPLVRALAAERATKHPHDVDRLIRGYEEEERLLGPGHDNHLPELCREIAARVDDPVAWLEALLEADASAHLLHRLFERCVSERRAGTEPLLACCLEKPRLAWIAVEGVLRLEDVAESTLRRAIDEATRAPDLVETLCSQRQVPVTTMRRLLSDDHAAVRVAAVVGEWLARPSHELRAEVRDGWRAAILRTTLSDLDTLRGASSLEFWLGEILGAAPDLSLEWLQRALGDARGYVRVEGPVGEAIDALSQAQRVALLRSLADPSVDVASRVVGGDVEVYEALLALDAGQGVHLGPLRDPSSRTWSKLVRAALDAGYTARDVVDAALDGWDARLGDGEERLERCGAAFAALLDEDDAGLAEVAREAERALDRLRAEARDAARRLARTGL